MPGSAASSGRIWRSSSVGALEARRRHVASEVRLLQQADASAASARFEAAAPSAARYSAFARKSEAAVCRVELWAQHVAEHTELVARAMDLDRVTADAITESQVLSEASRVARWEKHGLGPPPDGFSSTPQSWFYRPLPPMSTARHHMSASTLESPRDTWRSELPYARLNGSAVDMSQSTLGVSLVPDSLRLSASRLPDTSRLSSSRIAWMHERPPSPEPMRPAIYSAASPRRRHRTDLQTYLPGSPFRPVFPNRSEAGYALESPRQHSPYWQHSPRNGGGAMQGSTLRGGGISEIRAKKERLAEVSNSLDSPRQSPSRLYSPRGSSGLGPTLLAASMAEIKARRERIAREVAKLNSNSLTTSWRSPFALEA